MLTAYSRVTVVTNDRRIDLALPSELPLSDVLPQVMRFAAPDSHIDGPISWTVAKLGGTGISLSQTLAESGVLDGDVLELRPQAEDVRPAVVEDVRDAVEDSVDAAGGVWATRTTGSFVVSVGGGLLGVLGVAVLAHGMSGGLGWLEQLDQPIAAFGAVAGLLFTMWWATQFARDLDAQIAAAAAMAWGAVLGEGIASNAALSGAGRSAALTLILTTVLAAVVAGLSRLLTPATTGHAAAGAVLAIGGLVQGIAGLVGLDTEQTLRLLPVLALLATGVMPRVSLSVGGLASADYRVRHVGRLDLTTLRRRYRDSNALLVGSLVGIGLLLTCCALALETHNQPWDRTLGISLGVGALLRSRLFSRTQHMLPLRIAGLLVLALTALRAASADPAVLAWLPLILVAVVMLGVGLASLPMSEITRARVKRVLNAVEFLVIVDILVVLFGAMGVYAWVAGKI